MEPQVLPAPLRVENVVEAPQVFNQVDVPAPQVVIDLSDIGAAVTEMAEIARRQSRVMEALLIELRWMNTKRTVRTIKKDAEGNIESVIEEQEDGRPL